MVRITKDQLDALNAGDKTPKVRKSRPRQKPGEMNGTERRYALLLEQRKLAGEVTSYLFERIKFKLAPKTFYTPDFYVVTPECIEIHEVKGHWEDDARVKIKVAAEMFPEFKWLAVQWKNKTVGWVFEEF